MCTEETKTYQELIKAEAEIDWDSKNFWNIIRFYLIECPSRNGGLQNPVSAKGKLLAAYGWEGGPKFSELKKAFIHACSRLETFEGVKNGSIKSKLEGIAPPTEYCSFSFSSNEMETLLRKIRNAFAHGNFYPIKFRGQKIYVLQSFYHGKLNAEMALYEQTLLNWIDVIKEGPIKVKQEEKGIT